MTFRVPNHYAFRNRRLAAGPASHDFASRPDLEREHPMNGHAPKGFHTITPFLIAKEPRKLIDFLVRGLGATVTIPSESDEHFHAEVRVGDSMVMVGGVVGPDWPAYSAELYLYVPDCDELYKQALAAGRVSSEAPKDRDWGDRLGAVRDPAGNRWMLATCKEDRRPSA